MIIHNLPVAVNLTVLVVTPKLKCPRMWRLKVDRIYNMSAKEIRRTEIMSQMARKQITQIEEAKRLGISVQQGASGNQRKNKETVF